MGQTKEGGVRGTREVTMKGDVGEWYEREDGELCCTKGWFY